MIILNVCIAFAFGVILGDKNNRHRKWALAGLFAFFLRLIIENRLFSKIF